MKVHRALLAAAALASGPAAAEVLPRPGISNPRLQTARWYPGERVLLTMLPRSALTLMLETGERITSVAVSDENDWRVTVSSELDSLQVEPLGRSREGSMSVSTDRREYRFGLRTDEGLTAAYLVQMQFGEQRAALVGQPAVAPMSYTPAMATWRLKGNRSVYPVSITDDGAKITIRFAPEQSLPAVFALGPTGQEEVVNGYMRGDAFVIDRVHEQLVFRIDREQASARRIVAK